MKEQNTIIQIRAPNLSVKKPPKKGRMMFGTEYTVYNSENMVSKSDCFPK
jgi:hypothetical protein